MELVKRTWAEISLDAVAHNVQEIRRGLSSGARIMGVVKADGYGHGDIQVARTLEENGVSWFGVSGLDEALSLRQEGIGGDILIFGMTPPECVGLLAQENITQTVYSREFGEALDREASAAGVRPKCHLKIDTGMGRLGLNGLDVPNCVEEAGKILSLPNLEFTGIFTHFASADEATASGKAYTEGQFALFQAICKDLEEMGFSLGLRHCCNSAATLAYPGMHLDMVRPGVVLYGLPPREDTAAYGDFQAAMALKTTVAMVKEVEKGTYVSYGRTYIAEETVRVATLPIGYADGYSRLFSNRGKMMVGGSVVQVIGTVCMDQCMVDVTGLSVQAGDEVTVFGGAPPLDAGTVAGILGTIHYEIACMVGKRVARVYIKDGEAVSVTRFKNVHYDPEQ